MSALIDWLSAAHVSDLLAATIVVLAAYVAFDLAKRAMAEQVLVGMSWLGGASVAMGTGVWSAYVVGLSGQTLNFPLGFHPLAAIASWLVAIAACMAGLALAGDKGRSVQRIVIVSCVTGTGFVLTQAAVTASMGLRPGVEWSVAGLGTAVLGGAAGTLLALSLFFVVRVRTSWGGLPLQLLCAILLGASVLFSQHTMIDMAHLPDKTFSAYDRRLTSEALTILASVGGGAVLLLMLLASTLEAGVRASLLRTKMELMQRTVTDPLTDLPTRQFLKLRLPKPRRGPTFNATDSLCCSSTPAGSTR